MEGMASRGKGWGPCGCTLRWPSVAGGGDRLVLASPLASRATPGVVTHRHWSTYEYHSTVERDCSKQLLMATLRDGSDPASGMPLSLGVWKKQWREAWHTNIAPSGYLGWKTTPK